MKKMDLEQSPIIILKNDSSQFSPTFWNHENLDKTEQKCDF